MFSEESDINVLNKMVDWHKMRSSTDNNHNLSELSVETSCEMSDPYHIFTGNLSPIPASMVPRKLDFSSVDEDDGLRDAAPTPASQSPPYRRIRALRLFDSPHTPKTLMEKCSTPSYHPSRSRLLKPARINLQSDMPSGSSNHLHPPSGDEDSALGSLPPDDMDDTRPAPRRAKANINPFTPDGQALNKKKRALSKTPTWDSSPEQPAKRLRESNISRYKKEFEQVCEIGRGQFGAVAKCVNRLDGCVYAVKRSLTPVAGSAAERLALREVYAHAALGKHAHVVRYYSAWAEDDHMIIQNEYCDGGSLQQRLEARGALPESELMLVLHHVAAGLAYIHSQQLVHMDVKPANIFVCSGERAAEQEREHEHDSDDGYEDERPRAHDIYKIGDLGHVTCISSPSREEGDCRYLAKEVLREEYTHLTKADIFSLGLTLFESAGGGPLPKNGQLWHDYRDGKLPDLPACYSREFNLLLKKMVDPDPTARPSARSLARWRAPRADTCLLQMRQELLALKMNNDMLAKELQEATRYIKSLTSNKLPPQLGSDSLKYRTRSAKRLQKPRDKLADMSPTRCRGRRTKLELGDHNLNRQIRERTKRV